MRTKALAIFAALAVVAAGTPAAAAPAKPGGTEPVYDYAQAIREQVWVQSPTDSDHDGKPDRVAVRIIRPNTGTRVPVIFQASPYYAGLNDVPNHDDIDRGAEGLRAGAAPNVARADQIVFSGYLDNYFVPRGYAVVYADSLGTGGSTGCPTSGGRDETLGMKSVVDWLNGRAPAFDAAGAAVGAGWSTGRTGMIGASYNGSLANAVASTGVEGLKTIVPIASISSWYDYYRSGGGVVAPGDYQGEDLDVLAKAVLTRADPEVCDPVMADLERRQDRVTGDYSAFWASRDYVRDAGQVRASVFLVHGLYDENVRTGQAGQWWDALARNGVPRKIWLMSAAHQDPFNMRRDVWLDTLHRWFDQWLYGIDTGIMREPMADVETAPDHWTTAANWPVPGTHPTTWSLTASSLRPGRAAAGDRQTFVDDPSRTADDLAANPDAVDGGRLAYVSRPLTQAARVSGTPEITVRADLDGDSPYLTALLVDYGTSDVFFSPELLPDQVDCVGPSVPGDSGCFSRWAEGHGEVDQSIVTRGWLDVRNRVSPAVTTPVAAGRAYTFRWPLQTIDHVFAPGHRIGVVLISTERDHTLRYPAGTTVGVRTGVSRITLPLS